LKAWKKRWFSLDSESLHLNYSKRKNMKPKGFLDLSTSFTFNEIDVQNLATGTKHHFKGFAFCINTSKRTYNLRWDYTYTPLVSYNPLY